MTSRVTTWRRRRRGIEFINDGNFFDVSSVTSANDGYVIDFFSFLQSSFHLIFRLSHYSHEHEVVNDQSQLKNDENDTNELDQEPNYFLTDVDDGKKADAVDKTDVLEDLQVDSIIDENNEGEDEELFSL
jgi:hypothetical protein